MKTSIIILSAAVFAGTYSNVSALEIVGGAANDISVSVVNTSASLNASATATAKIKSNSGTSSTATTSKNESKESKASSTTTVKSNDGKDGATSTGAITSAEHRSAVATFVKSLLPIANRQPGIGAQVRAIAQEQGNSASTTAEAMAKVETRSGLKSFLLGSDYKNLGVIRSELAKTDNQVSKLTTLRDDTFNLNDRAALENELNALVKVRADIDAFVKANESKFGLFGWFTKMFQ